MAVKVEPAGRPAADLRRALADARRALDDYRSALARLDDVLFAVERRLETAGPAPSEGEAEVLPLALGGSVRDELALDPIVERVEELRLGCEALLRRPLRGDERPIVLGWAQLERHGVLVPVAEILELASRLLARPTPEGTLPSTLRWCDSTVQTLSRGPAGAARRLGPADRATELAALYEHLADELDAQEASR